MELEVEQGRLAKALSVVSRVAAGARATLPILNNVLIKVDNKKVTLTTTDLRMAVVDYLPTSKSKDGMVTVPARLLADFVSNLPKGEIVNIKEDNNKIVVSSGKYSSIINSTPADDFPELPEIDDKKAVIYKMGVEDFKTSINEVIMATSNDMTRPILTGVYFNTLDDALYIAATDGYRLAEKKFIEKVKSEVAAVVPAASLQEVLRSITEDMDEIEILFDETQVRFRLGEIEITSNLLNGSYPDYRMLIPKESKMIITLERAELMRVAKLAALFAKNSSGSIVCEAKKEQKVFSVYAVANELGENDSEIDCAEITEDAKSVINARYLIDALNVLSGDKVEFNYTKGGMEPIILTNAGNSDYTHLIMSLDFQ